MTNSLSNYAYGLALLWVVLGCSGCQHGESPSGEPAAKEKGADSSGPDGVAIQLNDAKRQLLRFESRPVSVEPWTSLRTIPAKLALDPDRHFAITSPVNVVVEELLAEVGSPVEAGTPLLKLSAPEITQLRGKLKSCKSKLEQMEKALAFHQESQECITKMKEDIQQDLPAATIAKKYQSTQYGKHGEAILEAYTRWQSSQQLVDGSETAIHAGALPKRVTIEREAERVTRRAGLDAALQQAKFDLQQNTLAAERAVIEARSELGSILAELDLMQGIPASRKLRRESIAIAKSTTWRPKPTSSVLLAKGQSLNATTLVVNGPKRVRFSCWSPIFRGYGSLASSDRKIGTCFDCLRMQS